MQPVIGILASEREYVDVLEYLPFSYIPSAYAEAISQAGGIPLIVPIDSPDKASAFVSHLDGIVLAGGHDIDPSHFNEQPHLQLGNILPKRDQFELAIIQAAINKQIPILGVCRGMQLLNVFFGGTLYQDLMSQYELIKIQHSQKSHPTILTHSIEVERDSVLYPIMGHKHQINSLHHQGVKELAPAFKAIAWSDDRIIEAIEHSDPSLNILGVQWHPELLFKEDNASFKIFEYFVNQTKK
ncbi:gamma-glutamyl-gamma-aminobutyrate hydrolase family protein [Atopobacter phocae]|uniref:gamma-glutamyl-gamma-aminobutyrate hydrolase family protein n=1 Tax=Atopobacter phocae TaxID=136492 RepID=UPI000472F946|nr:gamma-glutamyl-gamma-aminobutyrate hydrolase family protein [Atopobacter phocae]